MNTNLIRAWLYLAVLLTASAGFADEWFAPFTRVSDYKPKGPAHCFRQFNIDWSWIALQPDQLPEFLSEADPVALAEFCRQMHVDGTVVMAVPHHGYCTHETRVGTKFPGMKGDWFGRTIEELHKRKIAAFGYVTLNWNWKFIRENLGRDFIHGKPDANGVCSSRCVICLNAPGYLELVEAYTREVLENYPVDGMRWDILISAKKGGLHGSSDCTCEGCRRLFREIYGQELTRWQDFDERRHMDFYIATTTRVVERLRALCKRIKPSVDIWQNCVSSYHENNLNVGRSLDIAYNEFADPFRLMLLRGAIGKPAAINGLMNHAGPALGAPLKPLDHREWRTCLALGGRCYSYYGHKQTNHKTLLPNETLQAWHREQLAPFYAMVSQIEPWLRDATPVSQVGIVFSEATRFRFPKYDRAPYVAAMEPIANASLQRSAPVEFVNALDLANPQKQLSRLKLLILPLTSGLSAAELDCLRRYVRDGGCLLVGGDALRHDPRGKEMNDFALAQELGVRFQAFAPSAKASWTASGRLADNPIQFEGKTLVEVRAVEGETLLSAQRGNANYPLLHVRPLGQGRMAYLASLDSPELTQRAIDLLAGPAPLVVQPPESRVILTRQARQHRWVLHLLDDGPCTVEIRREFAAATRISCQFPASGWTCAVEKTATGLQIKTSGQAHDRLLVIE
ncbi:MAG: beta-galactosidase trimerization domain-containing protein [Verrucomicrobiia bacterium]